MTKADQTPIVIEPAGITVDVINRLAQFGAVDAKIQVVNNGDPFVMVPEGFRVESLSEFAPKRLPDIIEETVTLLEAGSFAEYVNRFKGPGTIIFAQVSDKGARFVAVLDYHEPGKTNHGCHLAVFETLPTTEWALWTENNRKPKDQQVFAEFIEDNLRLFVEPPAAELLELVTNLEGHRNARFVNAVRLQSGAQKLEFNEDVEVRGTVTGQKEGSLELPKEITTLIAPFQGAPAVLVRSRLKFRIVKPSLQLWYETVTPHVIVREAILAVTKQIADKTELLPYLGSLV